MRANLIDDRRKNSICVKDIHENTILAYGFIGLLLYILVFWMISKKIVLACRISSHTELCIVIHCRFESITLYNLFELKIHRARQVNRINTLIIIIIIMNYVYLLNQYNKLYYHLFNNA